MKTHPPISAQQALNIILQSAKPIGVETLALRSSHQRVIAEDLISKEDIPPFDNSSMDGFALRSSDTTMAAEHARIELTVLGESAAGDVPRTAVQPSAAIRIMTGAPIPPGADTVLEQELVSIRNGNISVSAPVIVGRNIRRRGEDIRAGDIVLRKGTMIGAAQLGVLSSLGVMDVSVFRMPSVAILATGNELTESSNLRPGEIRNSNSSTLWALVKSAHCHPTDLGAAPDEIEVLRSRITDGLRYDVLITTGGVSVGKYDFVLDVWKDLGVEMKFWKVNIKPGMPLAFGVYTKEDSRTLVFALPGNPVSSYVTFLQFVRPALRVIQGDANPRKATRLTATLEHEIKKRDGKRHFIRGIVRNEGGAFIVRTTGSQSSGVLTSLTLANCLILVPEEKSDLSAGESVDVELLPE